MNALDKAFIRAFAKDRVSSATEESPSPQSTEMRSTEQPPSEDVESVSLVLNDLFEPGMRLRIDRPNDVDGAGGLVLGLDAHMILPMVDEVQSYDPADVSLSTQPAVVYDDRLTPLDTEADEAGPNQAESDAVPSTDADQDMDVPASEMQDDKASAADATKRPGAKEGSVFEDCQPREFLATVPVTSPELLTREFSNEGVAPMPAGTADTSISVLPPDLDLDDVTEAVREQEAREQRLREMAVTVATQSILEPQSMTTDPATINATFGTEPAEEIGASEPVVDAISASDSEDVATMPDTSVAEVTDTEAPKDVAEEPKFTPAWEVDAFRWPPICHELDEQTDGRLAQSGDELFVATQDGLRVLAVTSVSRQEGRSTLALALAHQAALAGTRVALVDGDIANPQLARRLGMEAPCDWHEVVRRGEPLTEAAVASIDDRVTLFPKTTAGDPLTSPLDQWLINTLHELRQHYNLVVVDMAPLAAQDVAMADGSCPVDMAVVVRNVQETSEDRCLEAVAKLRAFGVRAVGVIENFAMAQQTS